MTSKEMLKVKISPDKMFHNRAPLGRKPDWVILPSEFTEPHTIKREVFGEFSRYVLVTFNDRFGNIVYLVEDAETTDPITGLPAVIRQDYTREKATAGLI